MTTFAIAFGLAGVAGTWSLASRTLGAPEAVAAGMWALTAVVWVWLVVAHVVRGRRAADRLADQLRHPAQGPVAALVPVVGMLLGAEVHDVAPAAGAGLVVAFVAIGALYAGWLLARWWGGSLRLEDVHGGHLPPTVAGGLIAGASAAKVGLAGLGLAAFAVGMVFWVVVGVLLLVRVAVRGPLPDPLAPTLAITVAPPAVGGLTWFGLNGGHADVLAYSLAGLTVVFALIQLGLVPVYRRLSFSTAFWSFTFPLAAVARQTIEWLAIVRPASWQLWAWLIVVASTVFVAAIGVRWLNGISPGSRDGTPAPAGCGERDGGAPGRHPGL